MTSLEQNYPNPFNPATTIRYELPSRWYVVLKIIDYLGQEVATLVDGERAAGKYEVKWEAGGFASRVYFYRLQAFQLGKGEAVEFTDVKRLVLLR